MNTDSCQWLHETLEKRPLFTYPFNVTALPTNGIYFFYEKGEYCTHHTSSARVVRVGTHRDGNFKSRICEHFLLDERKMAFTKDQPAPHDRSIFRKHIGRALLNKAGDPYLAVWDLVFTTRKMRDAKRHLRDISKETEIEAEITRILRNNFAFRFIEISGQHQRMGGGGLERALIGTFAGCPTCGPSEGWLGNYSPKWQIRNSGLWLIHYLTAAPVTPEHVSIIARTIETEVRS